MRAAETRLVCRWTDLAGDWVGSLFLPRAHCIQLCSCFHDGFVATAACLIRHTFYHSSCRL